ncbi:STAS domain-containing protein [Pontibacter sp. 172403-2]|uniref:STAS domain-containing protein n=1 Tax=Pontibacter rufus TaxID=2791028 RepID=UPI0018AF7D95|nr:STAS domain-containing protein [Pontibacter sp. 172403-2]MBF9254450.1 STAS domain-containing protein [Pontibacter sp. 172403-2]
MKQFDVTTEQLGEIAIVRLKGELDASTSPVADTAMSEALKSTSKAVLIDCSALTYISSAGLGAVLSTYHDCNHRSVQLFLYGLQPKIKSVLNILGLEKVIPIATTEKEALYAVNGKAL